MARSHRAPVPLGPPRGAVFLDRDGTLVRDPGYLHQPRQVRLLPGVAAGLAKLTRGGWPLVIVSNQSGIARKLYPTAAFGAVMDRIAVLLEPHGAHLLAAYCCPHHPDLNGPCRCRKPGTELFERAARDHGLDLAASWYLGDRWRDVAPALVLRGRGLMVNRAPEPQDARHASVHGIPCLAGLEPAAELILRSSPPPAGPRSGLRAADRASAGE